MNPEKEIDVKALLRETYLRLYGPPAPEPAEMIRYMELEIRGLRRAKSGEQ
jgi:hypothetical protein